MFYQFEIDAGGENPPPYLRMTQAQARMAASAMPPKKATHAKIWARVRRYMDWKTVCSLHSPPGVDRNPATKVYCDVFVWFRDRAHGDPDNIRKAVLDGIYGQDKFIAGDVDYTYDKARPRLLVTIYDADGIEDARMEALHGIHRAAHGRG